MYRPRGMKAGVPRPVVVFFYGGAWRGGEKGDYRFVAEALSDEGFVVVVPDYRLYPEAMFPSQVQDGALAVRWVWDHAAEIGADRRRLFLMGHSAGGHTAAMLACDGEYLSALGMKRGDICGVAGLAGPYDFLPRVEDLPVFGLAEQRKESRFEPIAFVDGDEPPMLLLQGTADDVVFPDNATNFAQRIRKCGGSARLIEYRGRGHVGILLALAWPFRWLDPVRRDVVAFFRAQASVGQQPCEPDAVNAGGRRDR